MSITVVITSAYPDSHCLQALASVQAQTYEPLTILLCTSALPDNMPADPRIKFSPNRVDIGRIASVVQAWRTVTTDYVMFLNATDTLAPDCLTIAMRELNAKPAAGLWYPQYQLKTVHQAPLKLSQAGPAYEQGFNFLYQYLYRQNREWYFSGSIWHRRTVLQARGIQHTSAMFPYFTLIQTCLASSVLCHPAPLVNHTFDETRATQHITPLAYIDHMAYLKAEFTRLHNKTIQKWLKQALAHHCLAQLVSLQALALGPVRQRDTPLLKKYLKTLFPDSYRILAHNRLKQAAMLLGLIAYPPLKSVYTIATPADTPRDTARELLINNILEILTRQLAVEIWGEDYLVATGKYFLDQYNQRLEKNGVPPIVYALIDRPDNVITLTPEDQEFVDRLFIYRFSKDKNYTRLDTAIKNYRLTANHEV